MKNSQNRHWQKRKTVNQICFMVATGLYLAVALFTTQIASAAGISRGYETNESIEQGMIVSLSENSSETVERSLLSSESRLVGIATSSTSGLITLSSSATNIQVVAEESVKVFVSGINGEIKKGDYIGATNIKGIGGKATQENKFIIGDALEDADFESNIVGDTNISEADGSTVKSRVSLISVQLEIKDNPLGSEQEKPFLVTAGESIAGKPVSILQVILACVVLGVVFIVAGALLYAAIRGSFISIGRNPLAVKTIHGSLLRVTITAALVLLVGVGLAYGILLI